MNHYLSFLSVLLLCLVTWTLPRWKIFREKVHPPILSVSAGVGISYVFLVLLPKLAEIQSAIDMDADTDALLPAGLHVYLAALTGFVIFLLVAKKDLSEDRLGIGQKPSSTTLLIATVFGLYNAQIGFLLGDWPFASLLGYFGLTFAFGMHFIGINYHLWMHYPKRYCRYFRGIFSLSLLLGWLASFLSDQLGPAFKFSTLFVVGGIIITAIREEIPPKKSANIPYFVLSVIATSLFAVTVEILLARGQ